jgi:hypothetical protein
VNSSPIRASVGEEVILIEITALVTLGKNKKITTTMKVTIKKENKSLLRAGIVLMI